MKLESSHKQVKVLNTNEYSIILPSTSSLRQHSWKSQARAGFDVITRRGRSQPDSGEQGGANQIFQARSTIHGKGTTILPPLSLPASACGVF
jgi:hypothetical protein